MSQTEAEIVDSLTADQLTRIRAIFNNTPVAALPGQGHPRVKNIEDVITFVDSIVNFLHDEMTENEELRESITRTELDFKAVGRVLSRMGLTQ